MNWDQLCEAYYTIQSKLAVRLAVLRANVQGDQRRSQRLYSNVINWMGEVSETIDYIEWLWENIYYEEE